MTKKKLAGSSRLAALARGRYRLVATKTIEDLAGNSVDRPFEVDELKPVTQTVETEEVRLPFEVK